MNTTVLALQEEQVLVAVGKSGAQPSVQALYSAPAHGGGMENWEKAIGALWQQHRLPTRGITLVLPDEAVATKTITAPSMPVNKLEELVRHEMRPREDQLAAADYVPLGTDAEGRQQLFCAACRKETMEEYLAMIDRLGLRLQSVTVTMAGRLKLLHAMQAMQGSVRTMIPSSTQSSSTARPESQRPSAACPVRASRPSRVKMPTPPHQSEKPLIVKL